MPKNKIEQPWERQKGESAQAFAAFLVYLQMGPDRSITKVVQELNKSRAIIGRWSSDNSWVERCRAWDNHLQREARKAAVAEIRDMTRRHITMARALQGAAAQALKERGSAMVTSKNLAAVVKLATDLELRSLSTEADILSEDLKKAEEDSAAVKIICDIPRILPTADAPAEEAPLEKGDDHDTDN